MWQPLYFWTRFKTCDSAFGYNANQIHQDHQYFGQELLRGAFQPPAGCEGYGATIDPVGVVAPGGATAPAGNGGGALLLGKLWSPGLGSL